MQPVFDFFSEYTRITDEEMNAMMKAIRHSSHEKNETLLRQGEIPRRAGLIIGGAVRTYYLDENGNEHTTNFIFENHPLAAFESFAQQTPSALSAVTLEPTELIWASHADFFGFLETYPKYETVLRNILSKYMFLMGEQAKLLRISSSRERYETLCSMRPDVIQRVPLKYIASYLGMALETLSRVRAGKL
jgi:CRP-like cAMP-binding protein